MEGGNINYFLLQIQNGSNTSARPLSTSEAEHHPPVLKSTDPGDGTRHLRKCLRRRRDGSTPPLHTTAPPTDLLYLSLLLLCPGPTHSFDPACATRSTWPCTCTCTSSIKSHNFSTPLTIPGRGRDTVTKKIKTRTTFPQSHRRACYAFVLARGRAFK